MITQDIEQDNEIFKSKRIKSIELITFKNVPMLWLTNIEEKENLLLYLDRGEFTVVPRPTG